LPLFITAALKREKDGIEDEEQTDETVPTVARMMAMRKSPKGDSFNEAYLFFCQHFLKCVVGIQCFNKQMKDQYKLSEIATPSDEALALLLLENNEYRWKREFELKEKIHGLAQHHQPEQQPQHSAEANHCASKYTSAGINKKQRGVTKRYQGWSDAGIQRFNTLLEKVKQDRKEHGESFDAWFLKCLKQNLGVDDSDCDMLDACCNTRTIAKNDLFDDDDKKEKEKDESPVVINVEKV
jgi:hypothetical protein